MGAGLGFIMGVAFLIISLLQFDDAETNAKDVALVSVLFGIPFSVIIGLGIGWAWGKFFGTDSLS
jgi:NhaP-type Na+/H+ or K+/H+ antiporter